MANQSGSVPQFLHGGVQNLATKMPAAVPNGAPPQWGQEVDFKSTLTSQTAPHLSATNGTRSSSQHSHPGSLSSHSSRDSSPAPSRIGVVHPNAWSTSNPNNPVANNNIPATNPNSYQHPLQPPYNSGGPIISNHSLPASSAPTPSFQPSVGQRMPPIGQVPARQQVPPKSVPSQASVPPGSTPSSTFGQSVQVPNPTSTSQAGVPSFAPADNAHQQATVNPFTGASSSNAAFPNSFGPPQYSQAPSNQAANLGQQPSSLQGPGLQRPGQTFPTPSTARVAPVSQQPPGQPSPMHMPLTSSQQIPTGHVAPARPSGQQMPLGPGQQMPPGPGQQMPPGPGQQMPPGPGQQGPPGPGQQGPPGLGQLGPPGPVQQGPQGPGQQIPPGPGQQGPPAPGQQFPPGPGQQYPPGSGQQFSMGPGGRMPPGPGQPPYPGLRQQMPPMPAPGPGQRLPPAPGSQTVPAPGSQPPVPGQQVYPGPQMNRPLQPGQLPPMQMPPGQWPAGNGGAATAQRPSYPTQPGPGPQPYNSQPSDQSLSGPALQRPLQPMQPLGSTGQYPTQQMAAHPGNDFRRYPQHPHATSPDSLTSPMSNMSVTQAGFNKLWGQENYDLLQSRNILPPEKEEPPKVKLVADFQSSVNCSPDIFRCTLTRIPETDSLLKKSRLPLGVLIHPFRDLNNLPVIQCSPIVRCRVCRTYINPFVYFIDEKHWKCNLCFRVNELPDEFSYDPATRTYGEPMRRPEVKSSTIEFIAPAEYMLRPPQPAVYLFLLDVSRLAVESGYLQLVCETILSELESLPGDGRTSVGFITYDSSVHFYSLAEGLSAPQQMVVMDIEDVFLPCPENLLANLGERKELVQNLLHLLPSKFSETFDTGSALGAALQAAFKLMSPTGGRVTVFQCCLPNKGPGALKPREDPANRASKDVPHLNPATDFYKQLALEFSGQQTAVDLFLLNQQYSDLATISGVSRFSGGCIYHFPLFQSSNIQLAESFEFGLRRYLERKIGFEAVMRIRCSRGLSIHTFHGNFYVRSTDLLSLPNINPDAGFGMQVSIEENLSDMQSVCFQAALLYTSGKGERRIRVHTLCLPIAASLPDILHSADQQCIIGLLAKMAVDRSQQSSLTDARDAFINVVIDALSAYKVTQSSTMGAGLLAPRSLRLLPLYILALLKNVAFRSGTNTRLDDRVYAMCQMKTLPLSNLIQLIYPDLYPVLSLDQYEEILIDGMHVAIPPRLHLSAEKVSSQGVFLLDAGDQMLLLVGRAVPPMFCENILGVSSFNAIPEDMFELPEIDCEDSRKMRNFITYLQSEKPYCATLHVIREDSKFRSKFFDRLIEDRTESSLSYYEFLQHIKNQIK